MEEMGSGDFIQGNETQIKQSKKSTSEESRCAVCSAEASKSCSACHLVSYCSSEHQKANWSTHKKSCTPFILKTNDEFGRHLIAARKLKAGTVIIQETSLTCSPRGLVEEYVTPVCLSCCVLMEEEKAEYRCSKCNWPTCCWTCEQHKYHAENECKIFVEKKIPYPPPGNYAVYVTYKAIEIARGVLLKDKNPAMWKQLMDLQHISELGSKKKLFEDLPKLRKTFGMENVGTDEDWHRMLSILNVNNFSMEGNRGANSPSFTGFVFPKSSMLAHSCSANCWWGVSVFPQYEMQVRTTVEIPKGDVITIPYSYLYNAYGTHKRQELIQDDGEFVCKCNRCLDPTELNSYSSALMCSKCETGNVLPEEPLISESNWKCVNCENITTYQEINTRLEELMTKLEECQTLSDMENFIYGNQGVTVNQNHWLITEAEDVICKRRALSSWEHEELTLEDRIKHIQYCSHLLTVKSFIAPGISLERARLINHLARAKLEKMEIEVRQNILTDQQKIYEKVEIINSLYQEALQFYKIDPTERLLTEQLGLKARTIIADVEFMKNRFSKLPIILDNLSESSTEFLVNTKKAPSILPT